MRTLLIIGFLALLGAAPPADDAPVKELARNFAEKLSRSRYMESKDPRDVKVAGWDGFETRRYTYSIKDKSGREKSADVIMLNPTAEQIARWIVTALIEVKGKYDPADGKKVFQHIISQSGGQLPVAGVVYEDILPEDGVNEIFCFRDGVTVEIEGVPHRGTEPMTLEQVETSIGGKVKRVFTYARIASTSPKMWIDAGGSAEVIGKDGKPTSAWLDVARSEYQKAWTSPRNSLIVAWVKSNLK